ncbi:glyoxalase/bleomycin resistance protein/dioxygenase [Oscillochloris trichoides DG-6]|uniref:Glyoxalase/bleomycin resistance protein/dioxygenase n=1 Tax=Oscillochloris trichoides DG-6 TaxID=765420 RepID=E1ICV7_9CHLR|nr:methylmalonyl-CoA epimerase [Oscillochloris trichoides]EFO80988.1 glyoxalase/bleomycin resistance protein/dioxygenase [Oscillochloris trichoides DG-6]
MFTLIDHIGFVVADVDAAIEHYRQAFGIMEWERIALPERHADIGVARMGDTLLELIAPTSEEASFAKFLREKGPGMHHIAYRVDDIAAALAELRSRGVPMIDREARPGIHNTLVAFVHPKAGGQGVLVELVQHQSNHHGEAHA